MANLRRRLEYVHKRIPSPVGQLTLVGSDRGLAAVLWPNDSARRVRLDIGAEDRHHPVLVEAERLLKEYFAGTRTTFALTLDAVGTDFQKQV